VPEEVEMDRAAQRDAAAREREPRGDDRGDLQRGQEAPGDGATRDEAEGRAPRVDDCEADAEQERREQGKLEESRPVRSARELGICASGAQ